MASGQAGSRGGRRVARLPSCTRGCSQTGSGRLPGATSGRYYPTAKGGKHPSGDEMATWREQTRKPANGTQKTGSPNSEVGGSQPR